MHRKWSKLNDEECTILCKSSINLLYFCTTCSPNLDEALELFDNNGSNPRKQILNSILPENQTQLENILAVVETTLRKTKEELTSQLSKCREMLSFPNDIASKPPALIANTVRYSSKVTSHSLAIVSLVSRIPSTRSSTLVKDHSLYIESESLESASCFINRQITRKLLLAR